MVIVAVVVDVHAAIVVVVVDVDVAAVVVVIKCENPTRVDLIFSKYFNTRIIGRKTEISEEVRNKIVSNDKNQFSCWLILQ